MMMFSTAFVLVALCSVQSVLGHGVITAVTGPEGRTRTAFGVDPATPRDGTKRQPFQQDSSIIRNNEIGNGKTEACGRTLIGGNNDITAQMKAAADAGMPQTFEDGTVKMTLHQVNGDGAGPYNCDVNTDGSGLAFQQMKVTEQVPGVDGKSDAKSTNFTLAAQMPEGAKCTGGPNSNACIVRCRNTAKAGPFGGCVAVTSNANSTTTASTASAATATKDAADDKVSDAERDEALAQDLERRAGRFQTSKRVVKSRVVGSSKMGRWI